MALSIHKSPPAEVEQAEWRKTLRKAKRYGIRRELQRARAEKESLEFGLLLGEIKRTKVVEHEVHCSFETWVQDTFVSAAGTKRTLAWANKIIETAAALEPWEFIVGYHRRRLSEKKAGVCAYPRDPPRDPCVTWWSCFEAVRLARAKNMEPGPAGNDQVLEWAHLPVAEIRALIQDAKRGLEAGTTATGTRDPDALVQLIDGKVDPNVRGMFEQAMRFTCNLGGEVDGGIPYDEATTNQRVERLAGFVLDAIPWMVKKRVEDDE